MLALVNNYLKTSTFVTVLLCASPFFHLLFSMPTLPRCTCHVHNMTTPVNNPIQPNHSFTRMQVTVTTHQIVKNP